MSILCCKTGEQSILLVQFQLFNNKIIRGSLPKQTINLHPEGDKLYYKKLTITSILSIPLH